MSTGEHRCSLGWHLPAAGLFPRLSSAGAGPHSPVHASASPACRQTCFVITFLQHWEPSPASSCWIALCRVCHRFGAGFLLLGIPEASLLPAGRAPGGLEPAFISLQCLALLGKLFLSYCAARGRLIQPAKVWGLFFTSP